MILLMSVNPGFGGQSFIPAVLEKITATRELIDSSPYKIRLEVDGGINADNIAAIARCGADTFVAGSAVFNKGSPEDPNVYDSCIQEFRRQLKSAQTERDSALA